MHTRHLYCQWRLRPAGSFFFLVSRIRKAGRSLAVDKPTFSWRTGKGSQRWRICCTVTAWLMPLRRGATHIIHVPVIHWQLSPPATTSVSLPLTTQCSKRNASTKPSAKPFHRDILSSCSMCVAIVQSQIGSHCTPTSLSVIFHRIRSI